MLYSSMILDYVIVKLLTYFKIFDDQMITALLYSDVMRLLIAEAQSDVLPYIYQGWVIVKINHYHDSIGAYYDSKYYHNITECD